MQNEIYKEEFMSAFDEAGTQRPAYEKIEDDVMRFGDYVLMSDYPAAEDIIRHSGKSLGQQAINTFAVLRERGLVPYAVYLEVENPKDALTGFVYTLLRWTAWMRAAGLNDLGREIHENADKHGWWDPEFTEEEVEVIKFAMYGSVISKELSDRVTKKLSERRNFGEILALITSENSEALEEYRNGKPMVYFPCNSGHLCDKDNCGSKIYNPSSPETCSAQSKKPEGIAVEIIDGIIRSLDYLASEGVDIDGIMRMKMAYNATRPYRHGGKRA